MLDQKPLNKLLFIDIETTSLNESYNDLSEHQRGIFKKRFKKDIAAEIDRKLLSIDIIEKLKKEITTETVEDAAPKKTTKKKQESKTLTPEELIKKIEQEVLLEMYNTKAPIVSEYAKIICISCGVVWKNPDENFYNVKIISFADEDERKLLSDFINHEKLGVILSKIPGKFEKNLDNFWALLGHNSKVFDFPMIARRLVINGFKLPAMFDYSHLKSWDVSNFLLCTKELWAYNVFDASSSLDLLADVFNVKSSKTELSGEKVKDTFWIEKDLPKIVRYCEEDVVCLIKIVLKMKGIFEDVMLFQKPTQNTQQANMQEHGQSE